MKVSVGWHCCKNLRSRPQGKLLGIVAAYKLMTRFSIDRVACMMPFYKYHCVELIKHAAEWVSMLYGILYTIPMQNIVLYVIDWTMYFWRSKK